MMRKLHRLQDAVRAAGLDAWVLYDFRGSNPLAWKVLDLSADAHCTRRWMVVIPASGHVVKIVHRMEQTPLEHLPVDAIPYNTYQSWDAAVAKALEGKRTVAMEYSPGNALPIVSKVDAGTIESIRALGVDVVSSADLLQAETAVLSPDQIAGNAVTAGHLRDAVLAGFRHVRDRISSGGTTTELDVQRVVLDYFESHGLVTDTAPIVAIGPNAASPHYAPSSMHNAVIGPDVVVLIDAWAKSRNPGSVYADITWVGYTGTSVPSDIADRFAVIVRGRDAAVDLIKARLSAKQPVHGYEVDRACRSVIDAAGLGHLFIHRTGHSITDEVHGPGTNMDDFETRDTRRILPGTTFSIEPGVYEDGVLGLRTEIDVVIDHDGSVNIPSGPIQHTILPLLAEGGIPTT